MIVSAAIELSLNMPARQQVDMISVAGQGIGACMG